MTDFKHHLSELFDHQELQVSEILLASGQVLFSQSQTPRQYVYRVISGQIWIYQTGPTGERRLLEILGPGDWLGTSALANLCSPCCEAIAEGETKVLMARGEQVVELLASRPDAATALIRELSAKLHDARQEAARMIFDDCNQRLIKTLLKFSHSVAAEQRDNRIVLHITHQQLAQAVGAARETISLALTSLRRRNLLLTGRNQLSFNPECLQKAVVPCNCLPTPVGQTEITRDPVAG